MVKHFYESIHGWSNFLPWYQQAVDEAEDYDNFAEVGVFRGRSSAFMGVAILNSGKLITHYAIDSWTGPYAEKYLIAKQNLAPVAGVVKIIKAASIQAASEFKKDGTKFRMVMIDGDHSYLSVRQDIETWFPLIVKGGTIMGDDYNDRFPGVKKAVEEAFDMFEIGLPNVQVPFNCWRVVKE